MDGKHECCPCGTGYHRGGWICYGCGSPPWHCLRPESCRCIESNEVRDGKEGRVKSKHGKALL